MIRQKWLWVLRRLPLLVALLLGLTLTSGAEGCEDSGGGSGISSDPVYKAAMAECDKLTDFTKEQSCKNKAYVEAKARAVAEEGGHDDGSGGAGGNAGPLPIGCTLPDLGDYKNYKGACITPRMNRFVEQAPRNYYNHIWNCWRPPQPYQHPLGRACDFALRADKGIATGKEKRNGSKLANWAVANANRLDVYYVIWNKRIWTRSDGWHRYSGATGKPNTDHTDHVHVSVCEGDC